MTEKFLDASGFICPLPVLKARKILLGMQPGDRLRVIITDKAALKDFPLFCTESGHQLIAIHDADKTAEIILQCK